MGRLGFAFAVVLAVVGAAASPAAAEPYLAQREGWKCSKCHVNRTGGGKRTTFGWQYAVTQLAAAPWDGGRLIDPHFNDFVSVGANFRVSSTTAFADDVHNTFESQEANLYLELQAAPRLIAYADVSVAAGSVESREAFALLTLPRGMSLKAGYLLLPFGLRIWGDDEFTRRETGYNYAAPDLGLEVGVERGPVGVFLAVSNGAGGGLDADNWKKASFLGEATWRRARVGLSGSWNRSATREVILGGLHVGLTLGRFVILAEGDVLETRFLEEDDAARSLLVYVEGDALLARGLNLKLGYGYHDPALDVSEDQRMSARATLEWFPRPFVGASVSYHLRESVPQDEVGNADLVVGELHVFL